MAEPFPFRLILASGSPARRELLERAGYPFEVLPADIDEPPGHQFTDPRAMVEQTAWLKAAAVAPRVADGIVLAADTIGWLNTQAIGKPTDEADARRILRLLGGTIHELWTGVCLWSRPGDLQIAWQEMTVVAFKQLDDRELAAYLATRQWQGCSGAYAILERDDPFVWVVRGSHSNVVGLPMESLAAVLRGLTGSTLPLSFPPVANI
jgi:septum formation protein